MEDIGFAKIKAAQAEMVSEAFNCSVNCYTSGEIASAKAELAANMAAVKKDPALSKLMPNTFEGAYGAQYDKFGNKVGGPVSVPSWYQKKAQEDIEKAKAQAALKAKIEAHKAKSIKDPPTKPSPSFYNKYTKSNYNINNDQKLIQRVGIASNLNVQIQNRFSQFNARMRLYCSKCHAEKQFVDTEAFEQSAEGLVPEILDFCTEHAHDDNHVPLIAAPGTSMQKGVVAEATVGRRFRDD